MKPLAKQLALLGALACGLMQAQGTTVNGVITDPAGDRLSGACTIQAVTQFTGGAYRVVGSPVTVIFTNGNFSVSLVPTDSATPAGQYYRVTCSTPLQVSGGHTVQPANWGPRYWLVPTSGTPVDISAVEQMAAPPGPTFIILWQQMGQNGAALGQGPVWSGTSWIPGLSSYSIDLLVPDVADSGLLQKVEAFAYAISSVSCSVDSSSSSAQINLEVRGANPNITGTNVTGTPIFCPGDHWNMIPVSPPLLVPAGQSVALDVISASGTPGAVRVNVYR